VINSEDILQAHKRIAGYIRGTPTFHLPHYRPDSEGEIVYKLENLQVTGSFKIRGAANKLLKMVETARGTGVLAVSTGNHGRAVAYMASRLGIRAVICLSRGVAPVKIAAIQQLGAEIRTTGDSYDEATAYAKELCVSEKLTFIEPFDDPDIIAGQATIGLELIDSEPGLDAIFVPMSGGGLISGIGLAYKRVFPGTRVVGITMEGGAVMAESLNRGEIVDLPEEETLADALVGGLGDSNQYTFSLCQQLVDDLILVDEDEIRKAVVHAFEDLRMLVEGGGAVGIAAAQSGKVEGFGERIGVIVSGGNIGLSQVDQLVSN
jgi:threonine dehydratase